MGTGQASRACLKNTFDGDTTSANFVYTDEAISEVKVFFNAKKAYVGTDGQFINDTNVDTIAHVLNNITGPRKYIKT